MRIDSQWEWIGCGCYTEAYRDTDGSVVVRTEHHRDHSKRFLSGLHYDFLPKLEKIDEEPAYTYYRMPFYHIIGNYRTKEYKALTEYSKAVLESLKGHYVDAEKALVNNPNKCNPTFIALLKEVRKIKRQGFRVVLDVHLGNVAVGTKGDLILVDPFVVLLPVKLSCFE